MKKYLLIIMALLGVFLLTGCQLITTDIKMGIAYGAPHGEKAFGFASVTINNDKIEKIILDEFQFSEEAGVECVPNSDKTFGDSVIEDMCLMSKRTNDNYYSTLMAEYGASTVTLENNYKKIKEYVIGMTVTELEEVVNSNTSEEMVDAVSGATLVDTKGYIELILSAAKNAE